MHPTIDRIRELFNYDPIDGALIRKFNSYSQVYARLVKIDGVAYPTANIVWAHYYGKWPTTIIDHKDRDLYNIEITNLRLATTSQNGMNQKHYNPHGVKGVTYDETRRKPWRAQIRINGIKTNLGRFHTKEETAEAYRKAANIHHGEFANYD